ncbi:MAG: ATP-binding protein [Planctomycetes bacterium]|nr:ATP-binding protein [Planctomycetota bacterium]
MTARLITGPAAQREAITQLRAAGRSFRVPHHSCSTRTIVGALLSRTTDNAREQDLVLQPGELTLATGGVLMLTDVAEWSIDTLLAVGLAVKHGRAVVVARTSKNVARLEVPVMCDLVATSPSCPCNASAGTWSCSCTTPMKARWSKRIEDAMLALSGVDPRLEREPYDPAEARGYGGRPGRVHTGD